MFAPTRSFSQLTTSFVVSRSLGIRQSHLFAFYSFQSKPLFLLIIIVIYFHSHIVNELSRFSKESSVENIGVEPMTSCVQGRRSSQLS